MDPRAALESVVVARRKRLAELGEAVTLPRLAALLELGRALRALGEPEAEQALRRAVDLAESLRERGASRQAGVELGAVLATRDPAAARAHLERALEGAQRARSAFEVALAGAELAALRAGSDAQAAEAALGMAREAVREAPLARARVELRAADVLRARNDPGTRAAYARALEAASQLLDPIERSAVELQAGAALEAAATEAPSPAELAALERGDLAALLGAAQAIARSESPARTFVEHARALLGAASAELLERGRLLARSGEEDMAAAAATSGPPGGSVATHEIKLGERSLALRGVAAPGRREELLGRALLANLPESESGTGAPSRVLAMLDRVLAAGLDLERLVTVATDLAVEATGAARGFLLIREPGAKLGFRAARRAGSELVDPAGVVSRSLVREVFLSGRALLLADAAEDPQHMNASSVGARGLRSVLVAPIPDLEGDGAVLGVLYLDDPGTVGRFGPKEREVAIGFAGRLGPPLRNVLERSREEASAASARAALSGTATRPRTKHAYPEIKGHGHAIGELLLLLDRATDTAAPALVSGESGTGKELVARALHANGPRARGPFVALSCAALADSILESELFGHVAGAFTGASEARRGAFERAHGGILFLDEIQEASPKMQGILLRVLESGEVRPVGGDQVRRVDVRLVAATNADLGALVAAGSFREDLYYRVNVIRLRVPPLRERLEDIPELVANVLERKTVRRELGPGVLEKLLADPWPGNVRALVHALERALVLAGDGPILPEHIVLEAPPRKKAATAAPRSALYAGSVELNERQLALLDRLRMEGEISNAEYSEREAISQPTGWRDLTDLTAKGVLVKSGRGKKTVYRLAPGWEARLENA
jgi:DNA-binding NtrC family response regulator